MSENLTTDSSLLDLAELRETFEQEDLFQVDKSKRVKPSWRSQKKRLFRRGQVLTMIVVRSLILTLALILVLQVVYKLYILPQQYDGGAVPLPVAVEQIEEAERLILPSPPPPLP